MCGEMNAGTVLFVCLFNRMKDACMTSREGRVSLFRDNCNFRTYGVIKLNLFESFLYKASFFTHN